MSETINIEQFAAEYADMIVTRIEDGTLVTYGLIEMMLKDAYVRGWNSAVKCSEK